MTIVLQLPAAKRNKSARPTQCRYCQGETFQRWGEVRKQIKDTKIRNARVYRYRCTSCHRTFREYPEGIGRGQQSERMKLLAMIGWSFGLSYRKMELMMSAFGVRLSRMSGWRDVQAAAERLRRAQRWQPSRVVGLDGMWVNGQGVMVAVDLGSGQLLALGAIDEKDMGAVFRWIKTLVQEHQIGAIVTDDLGMYRTITDKLELGHQVCQFHVRRWVGRTCRELGQKLPEEWLWMIERVKVIMEDLPSDGSKQLMELYKQLPGRTRRDHPRLPVDQLRQMLLRISENWDRYTAFFHDPGIPWTNNGTEQLIGHMKMRAKSVRGYKTSSGMLNGLLVSGTKLT